MHSPDHSTGASDGERRYITLTRQDRHFGSYLDGRLPDGQLALPVASFAVNTGRERVTFAVLPAAQRPPVPWLKTLWQVFRLELVSLTLGPPLAVCFGLWRQGVALDGTLLSLMMAALLALHAAVFAFNDYQDHVMGIDRLHRRRGSQVIQRGWLAAITVKRLAIVMLAVACLLAAPLLWLRPGVALELALFAGLAVLGYSFKGRGFKYQGVGDLLIFLCFGPLLALGTAVIAGPDEASARGALLVGLPFGLAAVVALQLRQLETIMGERRLNSGTLVARLGFDRAKRWIAWELALFPLTVMLGFWGVIGVFATVPAVLVLIFIWPLLRRLGSARSPLSSELYHVSTLGVRVHWGLTALVAATLVPLPL